jgi:hypothetical protein
MPRNADIDDPHADCICNHAGFIYRRDGEIRSIHAEGHKFLRRDELVHEAINAVLAMEPPLDFRDPDTLWTYRPRVIETLRSLMDSDA